MQITTHVSCYKQVTCLSSYCSSCSRSHQLALSATKTKGSLINATGVDGQMRPEYSKVTSRPNYRMNWSQVSYLLSKSHIIDLHDQCYAHRLQDEPCTIIVQAANLKRNSVVESNTKWVPLHDFCYKTYILYYHAVSGTIVHSMHTIAQIRLQNIIIIQATSSRAVLIGETKYEEFPFHSASYRRGTRRHNALS